MPMTTKTATTHADLALPPGVVDTTPCPRASTPDVAPTPSPATAIPVVPARIDAIRQHDGHTLTHLSKSSLELFSACPESWRRRYILGEKYPTPPRVLLGTIVDNALTWLARKQIAGHEPEQGDLRHYYLAHAIPAALARERRGVAWRDGERLEDLRVLGWRALLAYRRDLAPVLGRAIAAQRRIEFKLTPTATWTVEGRLDLEIMTREVIAFDLQDDSPIRYNRSPEPVAVAVEGHWTQSTDPKRPRGRDYLRSVGARYRLVERDLEEIVDYKVVNKAPSHVNADDDTQITTYLAGREIEGRPAERFRLAAMCKPTKTRGFVGRAVASYRDANQRRGVLARYANTARSINAFWHEFGPDHPWQYADPKGSWRCSRSMCDHWQQCSGGRGF
jgi:hypothetical protein